MIILLQFTSETEVPLLLEQFHDSIARSVACIQGLRINYYFKFILHNKNGDFLMESTFHIPWM